ncbi:MAG: 16S rRNA (guanine(966)-N(2))-methyltransferase RsmD [Thermotogota bacterium]|nr:16S rRNA (guanine(966)-N(2))-methyltransferase RsmD [Thermotogota bacterium]
MLTITGGTLKGRKIGTTSRNVTRYTPNIARKALFDIILVPDKMLDVFSGSGVVAFEALSRGTSNIICVDSSKLSARTISKNASELGLEKNIEIICKDFRRAFVGIEKSGKSFDVVFADPPFRKKYVDDFLKYLMAHNGFLTTNTIVIVETSEEDAISLKDKMIDGFRLLDQRKYGGVFLNFMKVIR